MATKTASYEYASDKNQLPYEGTPATYYDWTSALYVDPNTSLPPVDKQYDNDGVPVQTNIFTFSWAPVSNLYSPVLVRYRVRNEQLSSQSNWSIPVVLYTAVRYAIYKRRVATEPKQWTLQEVTILPTFGPYQENWAGRVQYAVCIHHVNAVPQPTEGQASATDFQNPYVLFATDPTDSRMDTQPGILLNPDIV